MQLLKLKLEWSRDPVGGKTVILGAHTSVESARRAAQSMNGSGEKLLWGGSEPELSATGRGPRGKMGIFTIRALGSRLSSPLLLLAKPRERVR